MSTLPAKQHPLELAIQNTLRTIENNYYKVAAKYILINRKLWDDYVIWAESYRYLKPRIRLNDRCLLFGVEVYVTDKHIPFAVVWQLEPFPIKNPSLSMGGGEDE